MQDNTGQVELAPWTKESASEALKHLDDRFVANVEEELRIANSAGATRVAVPTDDLQRLLGIVRNKEEIDDQEVKALEDKIYGLENEKEEVEAKLEEIWDKLRKVRHEAREKLESVKKGLEDIPDRSSQAIVVLEEYAQLLETMHIVGFSRDTATTHLEVMQIADALRSVEELIEGLELGEKEAAEDDD